MLLWIETNMNIQNILIYSMYKERVSFDLISHYSRIGTNDSNKCSAKIGE